EEAEEPEGTEEPNSFKVSIAIVNLRANYFVGDTIRIESTIEGECAAPAYQWQVDKGNGEWKDIDGATSWYYEYAIDPDNYSWMYRVVVIDTAAVDQ
ncbi:MAG: hypothetical protein Q4E13_05870, partial [Clostridia bacterium]|nr:hypothetical protein [Clostridia bacterium]